MAYRLSFHPHSLPPISAFNARAGALLTPGRSQHLHFFPPPPSLLRGSVAARLSPDLDGAGVAAAASLFERLEGLVYTVSDAAVSASDAAGSTVNQSSKQNSDWLSGITDLLETVLKILKDGLSTLHVPYAYGFAIILLTVLVKAATFPLTKKQVESALAMRALQPQIKAIQQRYAGDQEKIQLETARLYKLAGVNPLAGCLPTLVTIPVWIGLYRALSNVANEGLLVEGFFWIPSLAGPTTIAARQNGSGISWLFPFVDGHPPLGWSDTFAYLVLPVLLVISQYISAQIMQPQKDNDPSQSGAQAVTKILPLMIGYFALSVPSGLSLYWLTNNILSTAQQIWLQKLGGVKNPVLEYIDKANKDGQQNTQKDISSTQKSIVDIGTEKAKPSQGEQSGTGDLRRGERFKQIKEQEARRRRQREEARRAQEVTEGSSMVNREQIPDVKQDEKVELDSLGYHKKADLSSLSNGGPNSNLEQDSISLNYDKQQEEATSTHASSGNQGSLSSHEKRDQNIETDEV